MQSNPDNRRALLKIGLVQLSIDIKGGPNPFIPRVSEVSNDQDIPGEIRGKKRLSCQS